MTKLWQLLTSELGSAFKNQYGVAGGSVFNHWAKELSQFTEQQLVQGLEKFKASGKTYMSLNIFRNHCQPEPKDIGIDDFHTALTKVVRRDWESLHPAFQHIARSFDMYNLRQAAKDKAEKMFRPFYDEVIKRVGSGEEFERIIAVEKTNPSGVKTFGRDRGKKVLSDLLAGMKS